MIIILTQLLNILWGAYQLKAIHKRINLKKAFSHNKKNWKSLLDGEKPLFTKRIKQKPSLFQLFIYRFGPPLIGTIWIVIVCRRSLVGISEATTKVDISTRYEVIQLWRSSEHFLGTHTFLFKIQLHNIKTWPHHNIKNVFLWKYKRMKSR